MRSLFSSDVFMDVARCRIVRSLLSGLGARAGNHWDGSRNSGLRNEDWNLVYQALPANSAITSVQQQQGGSADGGEIFDKKVLKIAFSEPFALHKVCTTSFIKMLQGKVYCKAIESNNSTSLAWKESRVGQPGASGFCDRASEFCA